ncbi:sugar transferase [Halalkaliarchaeum sp. AArc-GB]|uniref:sugar transferase n=1 Tax=Halalkaliarchaeum sp. AArc-GB TaxID=3074078 RepID=UPI0028581B69|nr:sugar transferase [Halalkaliarchaeum sp. AArc-GB]MDR5673673.1 sugar transferase [Halalkaliarchaeum sp. AArc-GB]
MASATGVILLTVAAVLFANHPVPQTLFTTYVPLFDRLEPTVLTGGSLRLAMLLSVLAVAGSLIPLYKPQPRRILDTVFLAQKRVLAGGLALATLGFFKWSHRLPRATLTLVVGVLSITIPLWFIWIRRRPEREAERAILVGDDLAQIHRITPDVDGELIGCLCPTFLNGEELPDSGDGSDRLSGRLADGGVALEWPATDDQSLEIGIEAGTVRRLGGLSRLEDVIREYDVDTAVLAFHQADRAEFFGALDACYEHGVSAKVHRKFADAVLTADAEAGPLVDVDIEPWDPQDYLFKRVFDLAFAGLALLVLSPVILVIALAIKLEGEGPILFSQRRTYLFGETFTVYKFRTLKPDPEGEVGTTIDEDRETPLGNFLRMTHLDEIPQLWSILVGDMSVVGPRPAQTDIEDDFEAEADQWRHRWFVKPGLTGLAQINDATSQEPREKIQYDIQYIRTQSFTGDVKIVLRQLWDVASDVFDLAREK